MTCARAGIRSGLCLILAVSFGAEKANGENCILPDGLLQVHPDNGRFLTDGTDADRGGCKTIVLTGSHVWQVFQDYTNYPPADPGPDEVFNFDGAQDNGDWNDSWLKKLRFDWGHNFFRGWAWEEGFYEPWPYGGTAPNCNPLVDSYCDFDLDSLNSEYVSRLKARILAAANQGVYASVMLFQGWSVGPRSCRIDNPWEAHPLKVGNHEVLSPEVNGDPNDDGDGAETHQYLATAGGQLVFEKQVAQVERLILELHAPPPAAGEQKSDDRKVWENIIWQISNESPYSEEMKDWQFDLAGHIQSFEQSVFGEQHLVWMDSIDSQGNVDLFSSDNPADIVSPNGDDGYTTGTTNPPAATGHKVIIADSDHMGACSPDREWAWKSFFRGLHPIFMDLGHDLIWWDRLSCCDWDLTNSEWPKIRHALGAMQQITSLVDLAMLKPQSRDSGSPSVGEYSLHSWTFGGEGTQEFDGELVVAYHPRSRPSLTVTGLYRNRNYLHTELQNSGSGDYEVSQRPEKTANRNRRMILQRTDSGPDKDAVHVLELINTAPTGSFSASPPSNGVVHRTGETITFTNTSSDPDAGDTLTYEWSFGDGEPNSLAEHPLHVYGQSSSPTFSVELSVTDEVGIGHLSTMALAVVENLAPHAVIGLPQQGITVVSSERTVYFDGSGTSDGNDDAITYSWDFDNDGTDDVVDSLPSAFYSYPASGEHTARLTVSDGLLTDVATVAFSLAETAPHLVTLRSPEPDEKTFDTSPRYSWEDLEMADPDYWLKVTSGASTVAERLVSGAGCVSDLCSSATPLASPLPPGTYEWTVREAGSIGDEAFASAIGFEVLLCDEPPGTDLPAGNYVGSHMFTDCQTIAVTSGVVLEDGGELRLIAGESVHFENGFSVETTGELSVWITGTP